MIENYTPAEYRVETTYELTFDDGCGNGFGFPCDKDGNILEGEEQNPAAYENYYYCMEHPERFVRINKVVPQKFRVRNNAHGICSCGAEVELYNQYLGACECPKCGQWYNLFGQEITNPEYWEDEPL